MPEPFDNVVLDIIAGLIVAAMLAALGWLWRRGSGSPAVSVVPPRSGSHSLTVRAADRMITLQNVRIAGDLNIYLDGLPEAKPQVRDHFQEGERLQGAAQHEAAIQEFEKALTAAEDDSQRCALHMLIGISLFNLRRLAQAEGHYLLALEAGQRARDRNGQANALANLGLLYTERDELDKAKEHWVAMLSMAKRGRDRASQALAMAGLAAVCIATGELDGAEGHLEKAAAICQEIGDTAGLTTARTGLSLVYMRQGNLSRAEEQVRATLAVFQDSGDRVGQAHDLGTLGFLAEQRGEWDAARQLYQSALALYKEVGSGGEGRELVRRALERLGAPAPARPTAKPTASRKGRQRKK